MHALFIYIIKLRYEWTPFIIIICNNIPRLKLKVISTIFCIEKNVNELKDKTNYYTSLLDQYLLMDP